MKPLIQQPINSAQLSPEHQRLLAALKEQGIRAPASAVEARRISRMDVCTWAEKYFYIPETGRPVVLTDMQHCVLPIVLGQHSYPSLRHFYSTVLWSSIKKTSKTATSGIVARYRAETDGYKGEVLFVANDETQSRGRAYAAMQTSIELDPNYDRQRRVLNNTVDGSPRWVVIQDHLEHVGSGTIVKAINVDYRGEAGANPNLTCWTEAWAFDSDKQEKLYKELTPVPTRVRSQRLVESYAGYRNKSKILERLWYQASSPSEGARRLTLRDIPDWPWPEECNCTAQVEDGLLLDTCCTSDGDGFPLYVNDDAGIFAFIDQGEGARKRWPWLCLGEETEQYYREQAKLLTPEEYDQLHRNQWITAISAFIPIEQWVQCKEENLPDPVPVLNAQTGLRNHKPTPVVLGVDASVTGDCTGVVVVCRHPLRHMDVRMLESYKWNPPRGGKLDYDLTANNQGESLKDCITRLCARYNVVEIAYDEYQLHHFMTERRREALAHCRAFSQSTERDIADKQLYDLIMQRRISYSPGVLGLSDVTSHLSNAARKTRTTEDTKLHIVKSGDGKIDLTICLSMASERCLKLDL